MKTKERVVLAIALVLFALIGVYAIVNNSVSDDEPLPVVEPTPTPFITNMPADGRIDLADAMKQEAQGYIQRYMNGWGLDGFLWPTGGAPPPDSYSWPDAKTIVYEFPVQMAGQRYLRMVFSNVHVSDFSEIKWGKEIVGKSDTVSNVITTVNIPKNTHYSRTYDYHFKAVISLLESTKTGFEEEANARLGGEYTTGVDIGVKVVEEYTKQFGQEHTFEEDDSQTFSFDGPRDIEITAIREREQRERHVTSMPLMDYSMCLYTQYEARFHICFDDKEQIASYFSGDAPDNVGVIYWDSTSVSSAGSKPTAGVFRTKPYPNYTNPYTVPSLAWPAQYIWVTNQSIVAKDVK